MSSQRTSAQGLPERSSPTGHASSRGANANPKTTDAAAISERLVEGLAEDQRTVLDRVVIVDFDVAPAAQDQVEPRMPG
jgi:hypothetical protein